jgi:Domain of unknown function (DUF4132)
MLNRLFGLDSLRGRGRTISTLDAWHPGLAPEEYDFDALRREFMAPASPALREMLRECAAVMQSIGLKVPTDRDDRSRITAALSAVTEPNDGICVAVEAMLRLPFALACLGDSRPTATAFTIALERAVHHFARYGIRGEPNLPNLPQLAVAAYWATGNLFDFSNTGGARALGANHDSCGTFVHLLTWRLLKNPALRDEQLIADALDALLQRLDRQSYEPGERVQLAQWIVQTRGLPRSASATLVTLDAEFARRDTARSAIRLQVGPALGAFIDDVLDGKIREGTVSEFAARPEVAAMLDQTPEILGGALVALRRLERAPPCDYPGWQWLTRHEGAYAAEPRGISGISGPFRRLAGLILRKRIIVSDADMARLIPGMEDLEIYRSRHFLNQALKVAHAAPGGLTAQALIKVPEQPKLRMPADWQRDIAALTPPAATLPALVPPGLNLWQADAPDRLSAHFSNILDPRLHDQPHRDLLARLSAFGEDDLRAAMLKAFESAGGGVMTPARALIWERDRKIGSISHKIQRLKDTATAIEAQLRAAEPLAWRYPEQAEPFDTVFAALENKSAPTQKWLAEARVATGPIGAEDLLTFLQKLIEAEKSAAAGLATNTVLLRGLIYLASAWDPVVTGPMLADFALRHCYQSAPNGGIRDEKPGNACLWALSHMPNGAGVPWMARIWARVKYPKFRARIDAALNEAAAACGMSRGELDELCMPGHGLDAAGKVALEAGGGTASLTVRGRKVGIEWRSEAGKPVRAPTAAMKADKAGLQAAKTLAKEIETDLATGMIRLQRLYLEDRFWPAEIWRQRYLDHPLLGTLARLLIWHVDGPNGRVAALWVDGGLRDDAGAPVDDAGAQIRLWHPIDEAPEAVLAWRERLAALQIVQPFAQAWREIYRVTDAELATATYSNRWAGHILKQHQFMSLARLQGWTVTHRMWVDARNNEPAHLVVPAHDIVADYWVEGAGNPDDPEVLESNAYVYISTDRLTFSRIASGAAAKDSAHGPPRSDTIPIADVPPVVFSEVMRHCDLFTAIASIASDPAWYDRGRGAAHPDQWHRDAMQYWERESTVALREAARVRHALLEAIVPRLSIAGQCSFDDRTLVVRGKLQTYRIHIGSAAVTILPLMRHLCIVPVSAEGWEDGRIYLPFEGDRTLSVILSKAVLLAADDKITDPMILRQL